MRAPVWMRVMLVAALLVGAAGCGDDEDQAAVPTAEDLAASLVTPGDYEGEWTVNEGSEGAEQALSGVVPDELRELLPSIELCDQASSESREAAAALRWQAFRQLDLAVEDPIDVPADRVGHLVFLQEFLTSGEPGEIEATFDLVREGMQACLGELPAGEEGPGRAEEMSVPDVGDDRYGVFETVEEAGGWAEWLIYETMVREGPVLMLFTVVDIRAGEGVEPYYSIDDVGEMVQTAVDRW